MPLFLEHLLEHVGLVGGDEVHLVVDEPLQFVLGIDSPDVNLQLQFVGFGYPFGMLLDGAVTVVEAGKAEGFEFCWREFAVEVVNLSAFWGEALKLFAGEE